MRFQGRQPRGRGPRDRNDRNFRDDRNTNQPRKSSTDNPNQPADKPFRKRFIKRDQQGNQRVRKGKQGKDFKKERHLKKKPEDRDLDRELRDYWISQKGDKADVDAKEFARQKLDSEMDNYWKQKQEESKPKAE